jgi:arylformamidase
MSKLIDLTVPLSPSLAAYPGDPPFEMGHSHRIADGDAYNAATLSLSAHTGTHVDAPYHLLADGATVDQLPLEVLVGRARVLEIGAREAIERDELESSDLRDDLRVLLKTRMSGQLRHTEVIEDHVHLSVDAARYLVQAGIKLVGIDYLSVDAFGSEDYPVHQLLLEAGIVIVEGLDLSQAEPGDYEMMCLPLLVAGGDGAPARVLLRPRP